MTASEPLPFEPTAEELEGPKVGVAVVYIAECYTCGLVGAHYDTYAEAGARADRHALWHD